MGENRFQLIISARAMRDLESIVAYIAVDNPPAAERFGQELIGAAESIEAHPFAGRIVPEFKDQSIRERIHRPYRIVYRVDERRKLIVVSRFGTPPEARLKPAEPMNKCSFL